MKIREIKLSDSEQMLRLNMQLDEDSSFMLFEVGEREYSIKLQSNIIQNSLNQNDVIWLVAEKDDTSLQGFCVISRMTQNRIKHVGNLVIGVTKKYNSQGLGGELLSLAIKKSKNNGITRIELTVRSDNKPAISLYKKLGFIEEGVRRKSLQINNAYYDELYMAKIL